MIDFKKEIQKDTNRLKNVRAPFQHLSTKELKDISNTNSLPYTVCLLNMTGDLNIGTCIRNAVIFGARRVIILGRRKYDRRSTVGAENYINIRQEFALNKEYDIDTNVFWEIMSEYELTPIPIEQNGFRLSTINWRLKLEKANPCLIFGNEGRGISEKLLREIDERERNSFTVTIDQIGILRSLNVSSASAIIMHDLVTKMEWK